MVIGPEYLYGRAIKRTSAMSMYLTQALHRALRNHTDRVATVFGQRQHTYRQYAERVARLARN